MDDITLYDYMDDLSRQNDVFDLAMMSVSLHDISDVLKYNTRHYVMDMTKEWCEEHLDAITKIGIMIVRFGVSHPDQISSKICREAYNAWEIISDVASIEEIFYPVYNARTTLETRELRKLYHFNPRCQISYDMIQHNLDRPPYFNSYIDYTVQMALPYWQSSE